MTQKLTSKQAQRRDRILRTVRQHLSRFGYDALSMREIAAAAEVSPTTLYNLFDNQAGLVLAALSDLLAEIEESLPEDAKGIELLTARTRGYARQVMKTPRYAEAMTRMLFNAAPSDPISDILLHRAIDNSRECLEQMRDLGELRADADIDVLARTLSGLSWGNLLLWIQGHIALRDYEREAVRTELLMLIPAMTPALAEKYRKLSTTLEEAGAGGGPADRSAASA